MSILQLFTMQPQYSVTLMDCNIRITVFIDNALLRKPQRIARSHNALWGLTARCGNSGTRCKYIHNALLQYGPYCLFLVDFTIRCGYLATHCEMPTKHCQKNCSAFRVYFLATRCRNLVFWVVKTATRCDPRIALWLFHNVLPQYRRTVWTIWCDCFCVSCCRAIWD